MPIAEQGFIVKPPIETALPPVIDLQVEAGWFALLMNLANWVFLFPTQDVGGLRTAMVPRDDRYPVRGIGFDKVPSFLWPPAVTLLPAVAAQTGLGATLAHEWGHAYGLGHAPCPARGTPGEPWWIDERLQGRLIYPGLDVADGNRLVPSGTGEIMSYCGTEDRWPSAEYWETIRTSG
jgi:hypothetical protein